MSPDSTRLRKSSTEVFLGMKGEGAAADDGDGDDDDVMVLVPLALLELPPPAQ